MDWKKLLESALVLVVSFGAKWFLALIGIELDEALFNTIVAAIVTWLLGLFLADNGERAFRARFK